MKIRLFLLQVADFFLYKYFLEIQYEIVFCVRTREMYKL